MGKRLIHGERNVAYGHPRDNFAAIAAQWNAYLDHKGDRPLNSLDVANLMILMKVARVVNGKYHRDSYTDMAGYAGTGERLQEPVEEPLTIECKRWLTGEPRQWATFEELPEEPWLQVRAAGGEVWKYYIPGRNTEYDFLNEPVWLWHSDGPRTDALKVGPFTEVVDG